MRSLLGCAGLLLALGGCAGLGAPANGPVVGSGPLRAYLLPQHGSSWDVRFHVNQPAHVAVFRITPGRGTSLVYPRAGVGFRHGRAFAGMHSVPLRRIANQQQYLPAALGAFGPEFYFLIASEEPLDLDRVGAYGFGLSNSLGSHFASSNAYSTMERIASVVVPDLEGGNWTTDFSVHWDDPMPLGNRRGGPPMVQIRCNGAVYVVPVTQAVAARELLCGSDGQPETPTVPTDSAGVVTPERRQPAPAADRIQSTQLRDPQSWERLGRAADQGRSIEAEQRRIAAEERAAERAATRRAVGSDGARRTVGEPRGAGAASAAGRSTGGGGAAATGRGAASGGASDGSAGASRARPSPGGGSGAARPSGGGREGGAAAEPASAAPQSRETRGP